MQGKAWQRLIREKRKREWGKKPKYWLKADLSLKNARIKRIQKVLAEKIILEYEWLGTMGMSNIFFGIFFDDLCGGVVCYALGCVGAGVNVHRLYGVHRLDVAYLIRGACVFWTPKGTASKLIAYSLKELKKLVPRLKVAIAYADEDAGEIGTVYQSTNWLYLGKGANYTKISTPDGKFTYNSLSKVTHDVRRQHNYAVSFKKIEEKMLKEGYKKTPGLGKHRYAYILATGIDRQKILDKVSDKIKSYPKRKFND